MSEDHRLLQRYAFAKDETAFAELVRRRLDLVYSAAFRAVHDAELAKEIAQVVFTDLAKKSRSWPAHMPITGWLYRHTRFVASKARRSEARRRLHEERASQLQQTDVMEQSDASQIRPLLDEALDGLKEEERDAVVLRFFQGHSLAEVGRAFAISENAARMRIDRALGKLRLYLAKRGIDSTSAAIASGLAALTNPAPIGLAATVTASALASTASASSMVLSFIPTIHMTNITATVGAVVLAAGGPHRGGRAPSGFRAPSGSDLVF
jgi:RNA polymerase sigma factor (sigma-70 family)